MLENLRKNSPFILILVLCLWLGYDVADKAWLQQPETEGVELMAEPVEIELPVFTQSYIINHTHGTDTIEARKESDAIEFFNLKREVLGEPTTTVLEVSVQ